MPKIKKILYPTDFSKPAAVAYGYAESIAAHHGAKLFVIHVAEPVLVAHPEYAYIEALPTVLREVRDRAEEQLAEFMRDRVSHAAQHGVRAECRVIEGPIRGEILNFAETNGIDLIVMGTHGRNAPDRRTFGSVTEGVLRKAACPVLAVRKPDHSFVTPGAATQTVILRKILCCTDFSECSNRAADYAFSLAMEHGAEITLLHVLEDVPKSGDAESAMEEAKRRLTSAIPKEAGNRCASPVKVRLGRPYQEIVQFAVEHETDLIVVGVRGRNIVDLALFGSTTYRVIQLGPCPVLAVHC